VYGTREQGSGQVVVGKGNGALDGAGGEHDRLGANLPQPLSWLMRRDRGEMICDPLDNADQIAVVIAETRCPPKQHDVGPRRKIAYGCDDPVRGRSAVDRRTVDRAATPPGIFVADDHAGAGMRCGPRGSQARHAPADDEHVAMGILMLVVSRIGFARCAAHARGAADGVFVSEPPTG
jgi:hypothetical protein